MDFGRAQRLQVPDHLVKMMASYFDGRKVVLGDSSIWIERGCPRGSVVGPLLWNISFNYILENLKKKMTRSYAYADDRLILLSADTVPELYGKVSRTVEQIEEDMNQAVPQRGQD